MPVGLNAGDRAWTIVKRPIGKGERSEVEGAAQVEVLTVAGEQCRVRILRGTGGGVLVGTIFDCTRGELYACKSRDEHKAFGDIVRRYWPTSAAGAA